MPQMKISHFFSSGGLVALAAALAIGAAPAAARDNDQREARNAGNNAFEQRVRVRAERSDGRAERAARQQRNATPPQRTEQRAAPQQRAAPPQRTEQRAAPQQANRSVWSRQNDARRAAAATERSGRDANRSGNSNRDGDRSGGTRSANRGDRNAGNAQGGRSPTYVDPNRNTTYRDPRRTTDGRRDNDRNWRDGRNDNDRNDRNWRDNRRDNDRDWRDSNREHRQWDRRWRDNNRYNWHNYRDRNRTTFHIGAYYSPYRNYNYRRLSIGLFLDSLFYSNRYWISDPWRYRLPEVYGPYRWVRYYDDALLIDTYSGEVVDVIYDFFW
jgi:hypothetical protein